MNRKSDEQTGALKEIHSTPHSIGDGAVKELLREEVDPRVGKGRRRPHNNVSSHGPDLGHQRLDLRRQLPSSDEASPDANAGTHDVNDEMLAKAYRRGLRIRFARCIQRQSLDFLFFSGDP